MEYTVDAGYKNTVGSREECSYNRYVLITGTFSMGKDRNGSHTMVLITGIYCIRIGEYTSFI